MGFTDLVSDAGLAILNNWLSTRSYITGYTPSQADVACFKALKSAPEVAKYPHAARWYKHIATYEDEFSTLSGDATKPYTVYGPEVSEVTLNPAKAPAAEADDDDDDDDDDVDLFASDEEEDAEAERLKAERLAEYRKKKEAKPKTVAKTFAIVDVKGWGDDTDMEALKEAVLSIKMDGLKWGDVKLVDAEFSGVKKLQAPCTVEDEKVSFEDLQNEIQEFEDLVQSTDVHGFQKAS